MSNDRFASTAVPLSPRARTGGPVAIPLEWSKLRAGLDPQHFTIANARGWLKISDPWKDLDKSASPLAAARQKLMETSH